ncbi:hypothetical protein MTR_8g461130 [Medicago truncatula]|uniref:Uncharacterized protein n=1 Tax=Medicago truncatula TaxID=3880 RepID=A0A072U128_MEDTR|nr:hypothetical protein MTR_8g461130 [Medicago truncatula]
MGENHPHLFRIHTDVRLKVQLDQINHIDTRRVDIVDYRCSSTNLAKTVRFSRMKLGNDEDMRTMFLIFSQYSTEGPIELDA